MNNFINSFYIIIKMKKTILLTILLLLILPTILAIPSTTPPDQEPTTKKLDISPTCYDNRLSNINNLFSGTLPILLLILIIDTILKGFALWKATHKNHKTWFIIILILNTAGILPAIYLYINRKKK